MNPRSASVPTLRGSHRTLDAASQRRLYREMLLIRLFEEKAAELYAQGKIGGFTHLYIGQEAVAVGAIDPLTPQDYLITAYREHGQALAKGCSPRKVMAELCGRATGLCGGRGGSMHLFCGEDRMMGGYAIVGGHLPIAVGLAWSAAYEQRSEVVLCMFGDGAVNEGAFLESLNLAQLWSLPVIFLCENNQYGMGTALHRAASQPNIARHSQAYDMPGHQVDGMDPLAVRDVVAQAVQRARAGGGPTLIEALTYRLRGHSMADPLKYRTRQEEEIWAARDPLVTVPRRLVQQGLASEDDLKDLQNEVIALVQDAADYALASPEPEVGTLMDHVYAPRPEPALQRQLAAQQARSWVFQSVRERIPAAVTLGPGEGEE